MANTLTWLHLSDLHMRHGETHNLDVVLRELFEHDVPKQIDDLKSEFNFVAVTGDIAWSGKEVEYQLAREVFFDRLLKATGLAPDKLFLVPGNHDVDWDLAKLINPEVSANLIDRDTVTALLEDDTKRHLMLQPMAEYTRFVKSYFGSFPDHPMLRDPPYYYVKRIPCESQSVALIGINSTWLSGCTRDLSGTGTDRGNLLVGEKQMDDAVREAGDATVRIVLMHHPLGWLKEFDQVDVQKLLLSACHFVLQGHVHVPNLVWKKALGGEMITIPAGSLYTSRDWLNGYNLVQLDFKEGKGVVVLRRWSADLNEWVEDVQAAGAGSHGRVNFDLPAPLAQACRSPAASGTARRVGGTRGWPGALLRSLFPEVLDEVRPRWLGLGRERETQQLEDFLDESDRHMLWIWGDEGCGSREFLQVARTLLKHSASDVVSFDAEDAAFGITVDQAYFLDKLENWAGATLEASSVRTSEGLEVRLTHLVAAAERQLAGTDRRLVLIIAGYHLLMPSIREWVWKVLWGEHLIRLREHGTLAIFTCEGTGAACPASEQEAKIYLRQFTVQDIERFLHVVSSGNSNQFTILARKIHSGEGGEFLASPRRVYRSLLAHLGELGLADIWPNSSQKKPGHRPTRHPKRKGGTR